MVPAKGKQEGSDVEDTAVTACFSKLLVPITPWQPDKAACTLFIKVVVLVHSVPSCTVVGLVRSSAMEAAKITCFWLM